MQKLGHQAVKIGWLGALALAGALCAGCGSSNKPPQMAVEDSDEGRSHGHSTDDKARCEFEGRADREVSEATAAGAFQPNIRRVYQIVGEGRDRRKVLVCREVDTNLDGVKDVMRVFNDKGESLREEADTNYDGRVDSWITFSNGRIAKHELDLNADGKPDRWKYYLQGKLSRIQRDTNADGKPDVWEIYVRGRLERVGVDIDHDGRVDRWDRDELARVADRTKKDEDDDKKKAEPDDEDDDEDEGEDEAGEDGETPEEEATDDSNG